VGTNLFLKEYNIESKKIGKVYEGGTSGADLIMRRQIDFAVIIPEESNQNPSLVVKGVTDGYRMRRMAVDAGIPIFTNAETADLFVRAITTYTPENVSVLSNEEYKHTVRVKEEVS